MFSDENKVFTIDSNITPSKSLLIFVYPPGVIFESLQYSSLKPGLRLFHFMPFHTNFKHCSFTDIFGGKILGNTLTVQFFKS